MSHWNPSSGSEHPRGRHQAEPDPPELEPWGGQEPAAQESWPPADPYGQPAMSQAPIWEDPAPRTEPPPIWEDQQPPKAYLRQQPEPPGPPGGRTKAIVITLLVILVLVAGASALAIKLRSNGGHAAAAPSRSAASGPQPSPAPRATPTPARTTPHPSPSASPPVGRATVAVAPSAARDPAAASVASFLTSYFTAINAHDYQRFRALLGPQMQQIETAQRFAAGFRSTTDSGAVLIGLSALPGARHAAIVAFTSHQAPTDSPDHLACTHWTITLYLQPAAGTYVIGVPPAGYQASHQAC